MAKRRAQTARPKRRRAPIAAAPSGAALALRNIESSALVAALLEQDAAVRAAIRGPGRRVSSVTDAVLERVGRPFPVEPIRTLDAVHLATAEQLGEPPALVTIVTRDVRVRENAVALGYAVE